MYKNQLQELAQRSCFNLPSYACIREGPDHAPRFKASVNFNGEIFDSPAFFSTLRQAEHAAAEVALNTLADRGPSKTLAAKVLDETGVYKNLLQETAHRAGLNLPVYTIIRSGPGHVPVFSCMVELAGMTFTGEPAKTKKQAQKNAAIAAWSTLKQMSQCGSSSSATISGGHEEQEQVVVARFLASLNPAEPSSSSQSNQQKGYHWSPASTTCRNSFPSTPTSFGIRYQNWTSSNLSPEMASHHMWLQEQAAEQQRRLMALPIPLRPVPPPIIPWMHSMLQPSHHPYCLIGEQQPVPLSPGISMCSANSPFYFSSHIVRDPSKARSMVSIQEIQEEKPEDSSNNCPPEPSKAPALSNDNAELVLNEKLQKEAKQDNLPQAKNISSASVDCQEKGPPTFVSSRLPNIRFSRAATSDYPGNTGMALPTASQGVPVGPTHRNFRTPITAPRMQSGVGSFPVRPRFGRLQTGGFRSPFTAPAVQIRSVVPVCSAAPPRRMTSSPQKEESSDDMRNKSTGDVSVIKSKLGNLEI